MKRHRIVLTMLLSLLAACHDEIDPGRSSTEPPVVNNLEITAIGTTALPAEQFFIGTVESLDRSTIVARTDGRVASKAVKAGDQVVPHALLLTIADNLANERLQEAESVQRSAAAQLQLAEQTLVRYQQLQTNDAVTPQEFDQVASAAKRAKGDLQAATAAVAQARTVAGYSKVEAPFAAHIVSVAVDVGTTVLPGTPLLILDRIGGWQARLDCPETLTGKIVPGTELQVEVPAIQKSFRAKVSEVQPAADPASRTFQLKADLPDDPSLSAGLFVRAAHAFGTTNSIMIPGSAVVARGQLTGVYVVENGYLRLRMVRLGRPLGNQVEVLAGLVAGDRVVTGGTERAMSGARVED